MSIVAPSSTSVYKYYDDAHVLLYVGITGRGAQRNREHNASKEWWPFVTRQKVEHYPSRAEAAARERELIVEYRPPFNTQHNPDFAASRAAYLAWAATPTEEKRTATEVCLELDRNMPLEPMLITECRTVLRSRLQDFPLARAIEFAPGVQLRAPRKIGVVDKVIHRGMFLIVTVNGAPRDGELPPLVARVRCASRRGETYRINAIEQAA